MNKNIPRLEQIDLPFPPGSEKQGATSLDNFCTVIQPGQVPRTANRTAAEILGAYRGAKTREGGFPSPSASPMDEAILAKKRNNLTRLNQKVEKRADKRRRPFWINRVMASAIDLSAISILLSPISQRLQGVRSAMIFAAAIAFFAYYFFFELRFGRTPGKMFMGYHIYLARGGGLPSKKRRLFRILLRAFLGPIGSFSWKRVTILDAFTGTRVQRPLPANGRDGAGISQVAQDMSHLRR